MRVIDLVNEVAAELDSVERENLGKPDLVAKHVAVRVVPLVHLCALGKSILVAAVKTANVRVPGRILERAGVAQKQSLARIGHEPFVGVVLVVVGEGQRAIEAAGCLAVVRCRCRVRQGPRRWWE